MKLNEKQLSDIDAQVKRLIKTDSYYGKMYRELGITKVENEDDYLKIYKLILSEYLPDDNADVIIANSRMIGSGMRESKDNVHSFSILLISSKNQYIFKLSSRDRRQMLQFKDEVTKIAKSLVETGEIYVATDESRKNIGLSRILHSSEGGFLSIGKES